MTALAADLAVPPFQAVFGPDIMVVVPHRPGSGVVTGFASHTEFLFMFVLLFMTGEAIAGGIFVTRCFMATLAGRIHMASGQGKARGAVIKPRNFPGLVTVA